MGGQKRWQKRWDYGRDGRYPYSLLPKVKTGGYKSFCEKGVETKIIRLQLGTTLLPEHMHKIMPEFYETSYCDSGQDRATIEHYLLHCTLHKKYRDKLS